MRWEEVLHNKREPKVLGSERRMLKRKRTDQEESAEERDKEKRWD